MEKPTSPSSYENKTSAATATASPLSPLQNHHRFYHDQDITNDFSSMYDFIFPPKFPLPHSLSLTPSSCSSSSDDLNFTSDEAFAATEHRLNQARLILEYQRLGDHFDLCLARLQALIREVETLQIENGDLRVANAELIKLLSLTASSEAPEEVPELNVKRWPERRNNNNNGGQRNSLPKSVSVRSCNYLKVKQHQGSSNQQRVLNPSVSYILFYFILAERIYLCLRLILIH